MWPRLLAPVLAIAALAGPALHAASFPPRLRFLTLRGERVSVHYHTDLEPLARRALPLAEGILEVQGARYGVTPPRVHVVLSDVDDSPNGLASVLPYPIVQVRVAAPDGTDSFGSHDGWLRLVLTHELAHIVHMEPARALPGFGRKLLGRAPYLFPNALTPTWMVEGLATLEETDGTAFGRGRSSDTQMTFRMASLADDFPGTDRAIRDLDRWPRGQSAYLFGEAFLRHLERSQGGRGTVPELVRVHSGHLIPFLDELTAHKVMGQTFQALWRAWRATLAEEYEGEAAALALRGLSESEPLTSRGIRQVGPRVSPDGEWIAYTSVTLERFPAIRLMRRDGSEDRELATRNGGSGLSWTPDGSRLIYDEVEVFERFSRHFDLRSVEVASGRVERLTRGLRATGPDVAPDGTRVVFVRRHADRSELATVEIDGSGAVDLTASVPGTEWGDPRWSPDASRIAASRLSPDGYLDVVLVDPATGRGEPVWRDRARDVEPTWTPDGGHLVLRSDRDGISNLYVLRLADAELRRLTRVVGGAFTPEVAPDGGIVFASYAERGYDIHALAARRASASFEDLEPAPAFADPFPQSVALPPPADVVAGPYRPLPAALPRFWTPWFGQFSGEWRFGVASGGADPLLRHVWAASVHRGEQTERFGVQAVYQYDRWLPTFLLAFQDDSEPDADGLLRTRTGLVRATVPFQRRVRFSQDLSLTWRVEEERLEAEGADGALQLGGLELAWSLGNARRFPWSISPVEGVRLRIAGTLEDPALGSDLSLGKLAGELRGYTRVFGQTDALALRASYGTTFGEPGFTRAYTIGGFPGGSLLDLVDTNVAVLRGYPNDAFRGRSVASANAEYRFPIAHPQAGWGTLPAFMRHLHASVFFDAAHVWNETFRVEDVKTGAGMTLGTDLIVAQALPITLTVGLAHGFAEHGETQVYFRTGLSF